MVQSRSAMTVLHIEEMRQSEVKLKHRPIPFANFCSVASHLIDGRHASDDHKTITDCM